MNKILIIDDEVQIRSLLARMLELEGYEVCQAGDCKAALKQLEIQSPDVALCDVFLPDGNGVDLVLNIKKIAPNVLHDFSLQLIKLLRHRLHFHPQCGTCLID